jgi:phosphatidylinositol glycan class T
MTSILYFVALWAAVVFAGDFYNESLLLKPLPRNKLLASFQFDIASLASDFLANDDQDDSTNRYHHYTYFPRTLGPIIQATNTRELHLRFTQGWWDSQSWGTLPYNGTKSGGTGVELWAIVEAQSLSQAKENWFKLANTLSGFFCASLNFIDDSITTLPKNSINSINNVFSVDPSNKLYLLRAALPSEPICTENLTPFVKLLPTRGKAGISSLLDGHKLFDSLWHGMSIDITTECNEDACNLNLQQTVNTVIDVARSTRKRENGGIPKPIPGDNLRCDESKIHDIWQCFPLSDPTKLSWSLDTIFGRKIKGPAFADDELSTKIIVDIDSTHWDVNILRDNEGILAYKQDHIETYLTHNVDTDIKFNSDDSSFTTPIDKPPLYVSRSLTGYSQDQGGIRVTFSNPSQTDSVNFVYSESVPWFMKLYLYTLKYTLKNNTSTFENVGSDLVKEKYHKPSIDRKRPSQLELSIELPPQLSLTLTYEFHKSLLLYHEYPPDANHGFAIEPAIIQIIENDTTHYELRTTSSLLTLPTPDFSMPYNVIILTCTVMSLAFGSIFNLLTKQVITEEEYEKISETSSVNIIKNKVRSKIQKIRQLIGR